MVSAINFFQAAQVATLSVSIEQLRKGNTITGLAIGLLGSFSLEVARRINLEVAERIKAWEFRIFRIPNIDPMEQEQAIKNALTRLQKDFPLRFEKYFGNSSELEIFTQVQKKLSEGCCYGRANDLFLKIMRQRIPLRAAMCNVLPEDVFYHQILACFRIRVQSELRDPRFVRWKVSEDFLKELDTSGTITHLNLREAAETIETIAASVSLSEREKRERERLEKELSLFKEQDLIAAFFRSNPFALFSTAQDYQTTLMRAMREANIVEDQDIIGVVHLPQHVIIFQFGPSGYYLYDSFHEETSLERYLNQEIFFEKLRSYCIDDMRRHKYDAVKEANPEKKEHLLREDVNHLIRDIQPRFSIQYISLF